jgi:PAS domain S-box-containing protein
MRKSQAAIAEAEPDDRPSAQQAMRFETEEQCRRIVAQAPFAVAIFDEHLRYAMVSPTWIETFQGQGRATVGLRLDEIAPGVYDAVIAIQQRALAGFTTTSESDRLVDSRGQERWLRWEVRPWRDADEAIVGVVVYVNDVSALSQARRDAEGQAHKLKIALRAANAGLEAKAQFLANMSHEIRTPMNGVLGILHLLNGQQLPGPAQGLVAEALACGDMLQALLDDVVDISKMDAGKVKVEAQPTDPAALLTSVVQMLRPQAEAKGLRLSLEAEPLSPWILTDPTRLRQCLFNLIGNAVKFTENGSVTIRASVRASATGPRLRCEVTDTGIGITGAAQGRLFERFQQADATTTRRFGGSGLGLAITRDLAERMGGEVGLTSALGEGSIFWIEVAAPPAAAPAEVERGAEPVLDGVRVLVVEDNATNRMIVATMLETLGASVSLAEDGERGVEIALQGRFDLILMDIQMPGIDGLEATRRIRAAGGTLALTPIVALTANVMSDQRQTYLDAGMNGVVAKPISPAALISEIAQLAGR